MLKIIRNFAIVAIPLCIGNILKDFSVDNMKKTGLNGYFYDFSVDYDAIVVDEILDIHECLMKKIIQYKMFAFINFFYSIVVSWF